MKKLKKVITHYYAVSKGVHHWAILAIFAYAVGYAVVHIVRPYVVKTIIDGITEHTMTPMFAMMLFFAANFIFNVCFRCADYGLIKFELNMIFRLYTGGLQNILKHSADFFVSTPAGRLISRNKKYTSAFETLFEEFLYRILIVLVYVCGVVVVSFSIHVIIGIIMTGFMVLQLLLSIFFFKKKIVLDSESADRESLVTGILSDIITNVRTVLINGKRKQEINYFKKPVKQYQKALGTSWFFGAKARTVKGLLATSFEMIVIYFLVKLSLDNTITIGSVMLGFGYMVSLADVMWSLDGSFKNISRCIADASEMIDRVIEKPAEVINYTDNTSLVLSGTGHDICFDNVAFGYPRGNILMSNFNLTIPTGQWIGICGSTGSGKSTLINLILRKMDPLGGNIFLGNMNIKTDIHQDTLKNFFSYTPQDIEMFGRTIRENLLFARQATDSEIIEATKRARIHDFIVSTKNGYDTMVGEKGTMLSGGQKQRLGIARAILKNAPIVILDESTSALDTIVEREIMEILESQFRDKTMIVIAHRLSTIRNMDRIIVMDNGQIVQDGTHAELLGQSGHYKNLYDAQEYSQGDELFMEHSLGDDLKDFHK